MGLRIINRSRLPKNPVVAIGVLTFEVHAYSRERLLRDTLRSLAESGYPHRLVILDNSSTDGTADLVRSLGGESIENADGVRTCGRGMNRLMEALTKEHADLLVMSNDDIVWQAGFLPRLLQFWRYAPRDVCVVSGLMEPEYPWNTTLGSLTCGGETALWRTTVPGGAWTFPPESIPWLFPVSDTVGEDDVPACLRAGGLGLRSCCLDLSEHAGERQSTWGNEAWRHILPPSQ